MDELQKCYNELINCIPKNVIAKAKYITGPLGTVGEYYGEFFSLQEATVFMNLFSCMTKYDKWKQ